MEKEARDMFEDSEAKPCKGEKSLSRVLEHLEEYRKRRELFELVNQVADDFNDEDTAFQSDATLDKIANKLSSIRENMVEDETVWTFGQDSNSEEIIEQALHRPAEKMIKTGFPEYDERNGGLPSTGVMIVAATTSGGKSAVSMNLEKNLAVHNKGLSANKVTLEMSEEQEFNRIASMISGIPLSKFKHGTLTDREKKKVKKDILQWERTLKKNGSRFRYVSGRKSRTIDQLLSFLVPYGDDVIIIDYISLLEGVDDDNQWRMLSAIARQCKIFASEHKCLIILLAQLDTETSKLRYSKGIKEHADVMWKWNYSDEEVRATKIIPVEIDKVRDGELFTMPLAEDFSVMRVSPPGEEDLEAFQEFRASRGGSSKRKRGKTREKEAGDMDDDDSGDTPQRRRRGSRKDRKKRRSIESEGDDNLILS
jgi:replicative DNA helicase